jgi:hypothetical protein
VGSPGWTTSPKKLVRRSSISADFNGLGMTSQNLLLVGATTLTAGGGAGKSETEPAFGPSARLR